MEAVAHTLAYDGRIVNGFQLEAERYRSVSAPALVVDGGQIPPFSAGADALAHAQRRTLAGQQHNVEADAIAPVLADHFAAG